MALIDTARAMDDQRFVWRVKAAMLVKAKTEYSKTQTTDSWKFADTVLRSPMMDEPTVVALVATDPVVSEAVTVTGTDTVNTEAVQDADIQRVVDNTWAAVAKKYATPATA